MLLCDFSVYQYFEVENKLLNSHIYISDILEHLDHWGWEYITFIDSRNEP